MPFISFLLPGRLRPIYAEQESSAMVVAAGCRLSGTNIFHYKKIKELAETVSGGMVK